MGLDSDRPVVDAAVLPGEADEGAVDAEDRSGAILFTAAVGPSASRSVIQWTVSCWSQGECHRPLICKRILGDIFCTAI